MPATQDIATQTRGEWEIQSFPVVASDIIYKGSLVSVDGAGHLIPGRDTASSRWVGIADEQVDNSSGAAADLNCRVSIPKGGSRFLAIGTGAAQTDVGEVVYATDDDLDCGTPGTDPGNTIIVGFCIEFVSSTSFWVEARPFGVTT